MLRNHDEESINDFYDVDDAYDNGDIVDNKDIMNTVGELYSSITHTSSLVLLTRLMT